jgi:ubiquinone biosynthesis protein UbiJ
MPALETPFAAALNRLLGAEPWARERLAPFAGEIVELRATPLPALRFAIAPDGSVANADAEAPASLTVALGPDSLAALTRGEEHFMRSVQLTGNAKLASEVLLLVRHLRWDAEEDLSRLVGDFAAHRIAGAAKDFLDWQADAARRLAASAVEYVVEEKRWLVARAEFERFGAQAAALRDGLERLEARLRRLS